MARGTTIYAIRKSIPQKLLILVLNALVLSHLHYSASIFHAIEQNLIKSLEKQLNWSLRATFLDKNLNLFKILNAVRIYST